MSVKGRPVYGEGIHFDGGASNLMQMRVHVCIYVHIVFYRNLNCFMLTFSSTDDKIILNTLVY